MEAFDGRAELEQQIKQDAAERLRLESAIAKVCALHHHHCAIA